MQKTMGGSDVTVIDFKAAQKWAKIPKHIQEKLLNNVFCSNCSETTMVNYTLHNDKLGVLLKGKCKNCGSSVVRVVESE